MYMKIQAPQNNQSNFHKGIKLSKLYILDSKLTIMPQKLSQCGIDLRIDKQIKITICSVEIDSSLYSRLNFYKTSQKLNREKKVF